MIFVHTRDAWNDQLNRSVWAETNELLLIIFGNRLVWKNQNGYTFWHRQLPFEVLESIFLATLDLIPSSTRGICGHLINQKKKWCIKHEKGYMKNVLSDPFQTIHFKIPGHVYQKKTKQKQFHWLNSSSQVGPYRLYTIHARAAAQSCIFVKSETCWHSLSYEMLCMFLLARHEKKEMNVSGKIFPNNFYIGHRKA